MIRTYIALGSNLADPAEQLRSALAALGELPQSQLVCYSSFYQSPAMAGSGVEQPDYVNAVAALDTELSPIELLDAMQQIEQQQGREREIRWGARTLDLDLILYGDEQIQTARLTVPHYGLTERAFVLIPLFEIAPELTLPSGRQLANILAQCPAQPLYRL